jgi:pimeloyl-ACP methyl ester carboxylesterase
MPTMGECAYFSDNAYGTPGGALAHSLQKTWRRMPVKSNLQDNQFTGFRAHVYHDEARKEVVIAFAGTDRADKRDREACWDIAMGYLPQQFWNANALYGEVGKYLQKTGIDAQISFTGHSLGGALAQYMAIAAQGCPAVSFGGPGVLGALGYLRSYYNPAYAYPVVNHVALGDEFANFGWHVGTVHCYSFENSGNAQPGSLPQANDESEIIYRLMVTRRNHPMETYIKELKKLKLMSSRGKKTITHRNGVTYEVVEELNLAGQVRRKILVPV